MREDNRAKNPQLQGEKDLGESASLKLAAVTPESMVVSQASSDSESKTENKTKPHSGPEGEDAVKPKRDALNRAYATGRRKTSTSRVWIKRGTGRITVNGKVFEEYFVRAVSRMLINQPFVCAQRVDQFDVVCTVKGGGLSGQAGAVRHGIARALVNFEPTLRPPLKLQGFLTRDARKVERKKPGLAKARRSYQFSKR